MLEDYYIDINVYREVLALDDFGNMDEESNWQLNGSIKGFLQVRNGSYVGINQANVPISSHVLYCDIDIDLLNNDRIELNGNYYRIDYIQPNLGISAMYRHQECGVSYLGDI